MGLDTTSWEHIDIDTDKTFSKFGTKPDRSPLVHTQTSGENSDNEDQEDKKELKTESSKTPKQKRIESSKIKQFKVKLTTVPSPEDERYVAACRKGILGKPLFVQILFSTDVIDVRTTVSTLDKNFA